MIYIYIFPESSVTILSWLSILIMHAAEAFGLPLLPPSLARDQSFHQGANFAVGGATALDIEFFEQRGLADFVGNNNSLSVQIRWFEELKPYLCNTTKGFLLSTLART